MRPPSPVSGSEACEAERQAVARSLEVMALVANYTIGDRAVLLPGTKGEPPDTDSHIGTLHDPPHTQTCMHTCWDLKPLDDTETRAGPESLVCPSPCPSSLARPRPSSLTWMLLVIRKPFSLCSGTLRLYRP